MTSRATTGPRELRQLERRRRRGGTGRGPVVLQRTAARVAAWSSALRNRIVRTVRGDRPLIVALLGLLVLGGVVLSGPAQSYLDARERVGSLEDKAAALEAENSRLQRRADDLRDPTTIELLARESQGFVRPGEVAYALVPPEVERPQITAPRATTDPAEPSWFERTWDRLRDLVG